MSSTQGIATAAFAKIPQRPNPFHGLRRFEIEDSALFFGRDEQTYEVLRRLRLLHFVAVLGPSGCGKSSLIRAGVLAALQAGYMADDGPWQIITVQPGNGPLDAWKNKLRPHLREGRTEEDLLTDPSRALDTDSGRVAILVDQFEELFQYSARTGRDRDIRLFLQSMLSAASGPGSRIHTIITMRTEYLAQCASYATLAEAINEGIYLVPEMNRDQMSQAIVGPIRKVGAEITAPLVDRLLNDAAGQPDALPVLQHALMRMWSKKRPWEPLGLAEYERQIEDLGLAASSGGARDTGIAAFISGHAAEVLARLTPEERAAAQRIFQVLTELTADGRAVRHATPAADLVSITGLPEKVVKDVIEAFRAEGFLNVWESEGSGSSLVDITHEAVARQWGTLRSWMVEEARTRRNLQRVAEAAREWSEHGRNRAYLFRGLKLAEAQTYLRGREHELDADARAFLAASATGETLNRLLSPRVMGMAAILLALLAGLTWYSINRSSAAKRQSELTRLQAELAREQAARAILAERQARANAESAQAAYTRLNQAAPNIATRPQIFFQIRDNSQRKDAQVLAGTLRQQGFDVPGIQKVATGPQTTEVRYFDSVDEASAKRIVQVLEQQHISARPVLVQGLGQPETRFELWLGPAPATQGAPVVSAELVSPAAPAAPVLTDSQPVKAVGQTESQNPHASPAHCVPLQAPSYYVSSDAEKVELRLEKTCKADESPTWKIRFTLWEKSSPAADFREPMGSMDVMGLGNDPRADATAAGGLDAAQQKQAFAAAAAVRLALNGQATEAQATKAVLDILAARSEGSGGR